MTIRNRWIVWPMALAFLAIGCSGPPSVTPTEKPHPYLVGAYYYPWYSPREWSMGYVGRFLKPAVPPLLGEYDSADPDVVRQHLAWCRTYGIDFLAVSWWGRGTKEDKGLQTLLAKVPDLGGVRFTIHYESTRLGHREGRIRFDSRAEKRLVDDLEYLAQTYFQHPDYLRIGGRPVVFLYITRTFEGAYKTAIRNARARVKQRGYDIYLVADEVFWHDPHVERIRLFDAITAYNMYDWPYKYRGYDEHAEFLQRVRRKYIQSKIAAGDAVTFIPAVLAGYNDRGVRRRKDHYAIPRKLAPDAPEGSFFEAYLRLAQELVDRDVPIMMITSFNEWHEGSQIEPTIDGFVTRRDRSPSGKAYTQGFPYAAYGTRYLEILRKVRQGYRSRGESSEAGGS